MLRTGQAGFLALTVMASACGSSTPATQTEPSGSGTAGGTNGAPTVRAHPTRGRVRRVLNAASERAAGCLPPALNQGVTVSGAFVGATGAFQVMSVESPQPLSSETRNCVRQEFANAHVDPFTDERFEASRTFGIPDGGAPESTSASASATDMDASAMPGVPVIPDTDSDASASASTGTSANNTATPDASAAPATENTASTERPLLTSADVLPCYRNNVRLDPTLALTVRLSFGVTAAGAGQNAHAQVVGTAHGRPPAVTQTLRCVERLANGHHYAGASARTTTLVLTLAPRRGAATADVAVAASEAQTTAATENTNTASTPTPTATATPTPTPTATATPVAEHDAGAPPPASTASAPTLSEVANVMRGRVNDLRSCYQNQLGRDPTLNVHLRLRFVIDAPGTVASASSTTVIIAGDPDAAGDVARCVEDVARSTAFPAHPGAVPFEATLPFAFRPEAGIVPGNPPTPAGSNPGASAGAAPSGRVDTAAVSAVIRTQTAAVRNCYTTVLSMSPGLSGRVVLRFTVGTDGRISGMSSQAQSRGGDPNALGAVGHCIENIIGQLTLPPPTGGPAAVALPFDFGTNP